MLSTTSSLRTVATTGCPSSRKKDAWGLQNTPLLCHGAVSSERPAAWLPYTNTLPFPMLSPLSGSWWYGIMLRIAARVGQCPVPAQWPLSNTPPGSLRTSTMMPAQPSASAARSAAAMARVAALLT